MADKPADAPSDVQPSQLAGLTVDRDAEVPIGVQLGWTLCSLISAGRFKAGEQLPTLREMAQATGLNVNTIRVVYQRLELKGLVESQQGSGTFVAAAPSRAAALSSIATNAAIEARETGLDPRDVAAALYVTHDEARASADTAVVAPDQHATARRRALRGQIATLERTVAELEAEHPGLAPAPPRTRRGFGPALLTAAELAQVRTVLIRRLAAVQAAIDEHLEQQRRVGATAAATSKAQARQPAREPRKKPKAHRAQKSKAPAAPARARTRPAPASG